MTISCSDFTNSVWNLLTALNLVNCPAGDIDDLEIQTSMALDAITGLSDMSATMAGLLEYLVAKLPADDQQPQLPLDEIVLKSIEPTLRAKIQRVLNSASVQEAVQGPAARFMRELLDAHETITDIGEQYNGRTMADVLYLHSAIHKKTCIEVYKPTDSRILELVRQLPSADFWLRHIYVIDEVKAA
jgi:hypothetical protein